MTDATSGPKPSEPSSQPGPPDAMSQYVQAVRQALGAIEMTQVPVIRQAAERFAATILTGRLVHVFGTGHSRMAVEEMSPRYGSFPGFHPIVELSMSYHNPQGPHPRLPSGRRSRRAAFRGNLRLPPPRGSALSLKVTSRSSPAQTLSRPDAWCRGGRPSGL